MEKMHYYETCQNLQDETVSADIVLKGFFGSTYINIDSQIENEPEFVQEESNLILILLSLLIIIAAKYCGSLQGFIFVVLLAEMSFLSEKKVLRIVSKSYGASVIPYDFPIKHSEFNLDLVNQSIETILRDQKQNNGKYTKCKLCSFKPIKSKSNSSPMDFIITIVYGSSRNFDAFIRSARTSGIRAHIVIFTDRNTRNLKKRFNGCGVTFIPLTNLGNLTWFQKNGIRVKVLSYFFNVFPGEYMNRFLYVDFFDTVFQGDPFLEDVDNNTLVISNESFLIKNSNFYKSRIQNNHFLGYKNPLEENDNYVLCSGAFIAGFQIARFMFNVLSNWFPYYQKEIAYNDQLYFNFFLISKEFEKIGFKTIYSMSGDFVTSLAVLKEEFTNTFPVYRKGFENYTPLVVHQINRLPEVYKFIVSKTCKVYFFLQFSS